MENLSNQGAARRSAFHALFFAAALFSISCTFKGENPPIDGRPVELTIMQTADIHARLLPYDMDVGEVDRRLGLNPANAPFGGIARISHIVKREREKSGRSLYLDCGDPFQGAPIFNFFSGEAEFLTMSETGLDAMVIGNHEFDAGADNLAEKLDRFTNFPALAANYIFRYSETPGANDLGRLVKPFVIFNLEGLKVGVIGMGDATTMNTILESGNKYGITPMNPFETAQFYVNLLKPQVNVIIIVSHQGPWLDEDVIEKTSGIDLIVGGHLHIVLNPSKLVLDCAEGVTALGDPCTPRPVVLSHAGAFAKYVGRIDMILEQPYEDDPNDWEIVSNEFTLFPVDSTVPEDPVVTDILLPYQWEMERIFNAKQLVGYAPNTVTRFGTGGGDSQLGNLVATAMWLRSGIETDLAFTNTTGIRSDLPAGPVTTEEMINVFPFDNTITTMFLTGMELIELFDYASHRTSIRGCGSQVQIAGMTFKIRCGDCPDGQFGCVEMLDNGDGSFSRELFVGGTRVEPFGVYEIATNNYIAGGGSGYSMLRRNTSQQDSGVPQREALIDYIRTGSPCVAPTPCASDDECADDAMCACGGMWFWEDADETCYDNGSCTEEDGKYCVLADCVTDVAEFYLSIEEEAGSIRPGDKEEKGCLWLNWAAAECSKLSCIGSTAGNKCSINEDCEADASCGDGGVTCCKGPGATQVQTGVCRCGDACDAVVMTGIEDGRIQILTD